MNSSKNTLHHIIRPALLLMGVAKKKIKKETNKHITGRTLGTVTILSSQQQCYSFLNIVNEHFRGSARSCRHGRNCTTCKTVKRSHTPKHLSCMIIHEKLLLLLLFFNFFFFKDSLKEEFLMVVIQNLNPIRYCTTGNTAKWSHEAKLSSCIATSEKLNFPTKVWKKNFLWR